MYKLIFILILGLTKGDQLKGFEDKPALTKKERAVLMGSKMTVGALTAAYLLRHPYYRSLSETARAIGVGAAGGYTGYASVGYLGDRLIAWRHGVVYRIEKVARYFNINIEQYKPILIAAYEKDFQVLHAAMLTIYEQRFGPNWQADLKEFLNRYLGYAQYLVKKRPRALKKNEKELMRMIEIGAALENIYFNKQPSLKNVIKEAARMYSFLGFLHDTQGER
ncbi:hypothetical protein E3J61_03190 [Candidatus Dependentiae bacterium]|nr:MAG: hypothetical protein E3J61_03190 [Candidatus Dependentiae bacterium]